MDRHSRGSSKGMVYAASMNITSLQHTLGLWTQAHLMLEQAVNLKSFGTICKLIITLLRI